MLYTHMLKTLLFSKGSASPEPGSTSLLRQAAARSSAAQAFAPFILGGGGGLGWRRCYTESMVGPSKGFEERKPKIRR